VVRITNTTIICQIIYARIHGDMVLAAAYSSELPRYGVKFGLTNFAAAYCTGLLCARRALTKLNLASKYAGKDTADGEHFIVEPIEDGPRPFKAFLDVGLRRTTTGARIFGIMKGVVDGGIFVPHSERRFPGYDEESSEFDATILRKYIYGGHVADYMRILEEEDEERYKKQFSRYHKEKIMADTIETIYRTAHALIRKDPTHKPTRKHENISEKSKQFKKLRISYTERKQKIAKKIADFHASMAVDEEETEE
jgi:large subunit ribosomal protein L5e